MLSACAREILLRYKEVKLPSRSIAAGIAFFLNFSSSGTFLFSFRLIKAGVLMVLELGDVTSSGVLVTPVTAMLSIEFTNWPVTYPGTFISLLSDINNGK